MPGLLARTRRVTPWDFVSSDSSSDSDESIFDFTPRATRKQISPKRDAEQHTATVEHCEKAAYFDWQWLYQRDLPTDRKPLLPAWKLLKAYTKLRTRDIDEHVRIIRDKAYLITPDAYIGRWRFLDNPLPRDPLYPLLLARIQAGATFLDAGCCFGQVLRQLALDGAPAHNLIGTDLRPELLALGHELFNDEPDWSGEGIQYVAGDLLNPRDRGLRRLDGAVQIIHADRLFHLFGWDAQVALGVRLVRLLGGSREEQMILGRQVGSLAPTEEMMFQGTGLGRHHHNARTMQRLWDVIGEKTATRWRVRTEIVRPLGMTGEDGPGKVEIRFVATRKW